MTAGRVVLSEYMPARDRNDRLASGALFTVYVNRTTTKASIYSDSGLTTPLANPVAANSSGQFPAIWADRGTDETPILYTLSVTAADGSSLGNPSVFDDYGPSIVFLDGTEAPVSEAMAGVLEQETLALARTQMGTDLAANVNFTPSGAGAVARAVQTKLREFVSVKDFGATGDGTTDDTAAIQAAITSFETGLESLTGGVLYFPRGTYLISAPLIINAGNVAGLAAMTIRGAGQSNTFITAAPSFPGGGIMLSLVDSTYCTVEDIFLLGSNVAGTGFKAGAGGSHLTLRRLHAERCDIGIDVGQAFMLTLEQCRAKLCLVGFNFPGFQTSTTVNNCYALDNTLHGFNFGGGITYSKIIACGSDASGLYGYNVANAFGLEFDSCGAEGSGRASWGFETSAASDAGKLIPGIRVVLNNCFSKDGDTGGGGYGSAIYSNQVDTSTIDLDVRNFNEFNDVSAANAVIMAGSATDHVLRVDNRSIFDGTVGGAAAAGHRPAAGRGTTAARPTLAAKERGYLYFDTTLDADGKPIWWTGTAWVDATGATV